MFPFTDELSVVTILQGHGFYCNTRCSVVTNCKIMIAIQAAWCSPSQMKVQWLLTARSWLLLQYKMFSGYKLQDHDCYCNTRCSVVTNCKVMVAIVIQDVQWLLTARCCMVIRYSLGSILSSFYAIIRGTTASLAFLQPR